MLIDAVVPSGTSVVSPISSTFASPGTVSVGGEAGGKFELWSGLTFGLDHLTLSVGFGFSPLSGTA